MRIHTYLTKCEVRRIQEQVSRKDGNPFITIKLEDMEGDAFECSCRNESLFAAVRQLRKGDFVDLPVVIMATNQYQFVSLDGTPEVLEEEE